MGQSFFHFKHFSILSQSKGLKVTTDSCLLGAIASHPSPSSCLDIGTGTGVLSLMMAQKFSHAEITAIEIDKAIADQAFHNISQSAFGKRIDLVHADFLTWENQRAFDLIICNPPYFINHLEGSEHKKNVAMHNTSLPFDALAKRIKTLLAPGGLCWLICPEPAMSVLSNACLHNDLHLRRFIEVYNKPGKYFRTIACFSHENKEDIIKETLLLNETDGRKTEAFKSLTTDFYLENTEFYRRKDKG